MDNIEKLLHLIGVSSDYFDYSGQHRQISREVRERVLRIWGYDPQDKRAIDKVLFELDASPWESWLRPQYIVSEGFVDGDPAVAVNMSCGPDQLQSLLSWQLLTDDGNRLSGQFRPADVPETGIT
nr:hypothetical protein [uncultured bacterium]